MTPRSLAPRTKGPKAMDCPGHLSITRHALVAGAAATLTATTTSGGADAQPSPIANSGAPAMSRVSLRVNGDVRTVDLDTRTTLLDTLREHLQLTGSKKGC